ncbi:TB2/DP1, HVA22 family protein [Besnoitia besnoiti]|uniref:TB2/DP1, HVA22 family protein n=1 Tax=Besnoitia besnoiti TaxID=94643 RepID=A0A2A9M9T0_BESBE|nr:TB2/DP1, HVA22 family protein [Besnoitia besnoiti]PFH32357.1 TB2/DP1, HVA22 family protein [Besnoitia besnoiti]
MISILGNFLGTLLVFGVSFVYPAYLTFRFLLAHRAQGDGARPNFPPTEYIQHVFYWVLYAWLTVFTGFVLSKISAFIPLYHELRAALFYWLASPDFKGAGWLWLVILSPHYGAVDAMIRDLYERFCPPSLKSYLSVVAEGGENAVEQAFRRDRTANKQLDGESLKSK